VYSSKKENQYSVVKEKAGQKLPCLFYLVSALFNFQRARQAMHQESMS
jgi:hypothetical protein